MRKVAALYVERGGGYWNLCDVEPWDIERDARDLARAVHVRTDSFVALDYRHGSDSDDLVRSQPTVRAELAQGEALRWTAELGRWQYRSPLSSPFASVDGRSSVSQTRALFGARYAPGLYTTLSAAVGTSHIPGDDLTLWRLSLDQHVTDQVQLNLVLDHDRVDASPRSVSLGIARTGLAGHVQWRPDFNWTGDLWLQREHYSDGNDRTHWSAALRRAAVRRVGLMLDLGVTGEYLAFDTHPGNGYYAPSNYRRYALTASLYVGMGQDAGLSLQTQLGRQKDENLTHWRRAADVNAELVVGIFSPWQLNVYAGYSDRLLNTGAYRGRTVGMTLTRRF